MLTEIEKIAGLLRAWVQDSLQAMLEEATTEWEKLPEKDRPALADCALGALKFAQEELALGRLKRVDKGPVGVLTSANGVLLVVLKWPDGAAFSLVWPGATGWLIAPGDADALRSAWDFVRQWCIADFADRIGEEYDCADRIVVEHAAS